jgi:predicted PurR-regulated permease PerM
LKDAGELSSYTSKGKKMKKNIGSVDRGIRIIAAVVIGTLYFGGQITGTVGAVLGIIALILFLTSFVRYCPLYVPLKIATVKKQQ